MAGGCGVSHQCAGEPPIGDRETVAGVHWTSAGENIGEGAALLTQDFSNRARGAGGRPRGGWRKAVSEYFG